MIITALVSPSEPSLSSASYLSISQAKSKGMFTNLLTKKSLLSKYAIVSDCCGTPQWFSRPLGIPVWFGRVAVYLFDSSRTFLENRFTPEDSFISELHASHPGSIREKRSSFEASPKDTGPCSLKMLRCLVHRLSNSLSTPHGKTQDRNNFAMSVMRLASTFLDGLGRVFLELFIFFCLLMPSLSSGSLLALSPVGKPSPLDLACASAWRELHEALFLLIVSVFFSTVLLALLKMSLP